MLREQERNKKILRAQAFQYMWKVDKTLREVHKQYHVSPKWEDQCRLLTLKMWEQKYHVPLKFILQVLIPFWKKLMENRRRRVKPGSIGVQIATLTGKLSEKALKEAIDRQFPRGENIEAWRIQEQESYLRQRQLLLRKYQDLGKFLKEYQKICRRSRRRTNQTIASGRYTRRRYPNNPWC